MFHPYMMALDGSYVRQVTEGIYPGSCKRSSMRLPNGLLGGRTGRKVKPDPSLT